MNRFGHLVGLALAACGFAFASPAAAQSAGGTDLDISASVVASCTVSTTTLDFGLLDIATTTQVDKDATVTVACYGKAVFKIELDDGLHPDATGQRRIKNADGDYLSYEIYRNSKRTQRWGLKPIQTRNGVIVTSYGTEDFEAYGRLTGITPSTPSGVYTDTVTVTIYL